jgi:exonuclease III
MIIAWNVRGLNKVGKIREISSRLVNLNPDIAILIETRVKSNKAEKIRKRLKLRCNY